MGMRLSNRHEFEQALGGGEQHKWKTLEGNIISG